MNNQEQGGINRRDFLKQAAAVGPSIMVGGFVMGCSEQTSRNPETMKENLETLRHFIEAMSNAELAENSKEKTDLVLAHEFFMFQYYSKIKFNEIAESLNQQLPEEKRYSLYSLTEQDHESAKIWTNQSKSRSSYIPKLK